MFKRDLQRGLSVVPVGAPTRVAAAISSRALLGEGGRHGNGISGQWALTNANGGVWVAGWGKRNLVFFRVSALLLQ